MSTLTTQDAAEFEATIAKGGIAIFPTDTLYGIACDPGDASAIGRIHELKGRPPRKPTAVMYFVKDRLLGDLGHDLDERARKLIEQLLPGPFTLIVANPNRRFAPCCADTPEKLGLRVPALGPAIAALSDVEFPVFQTSANFSGGPDITRVEEIEPRISSGVDLVLDGGPVVGSGSTVADISELATGHWRILREQTPGASDRIAELIGHPPSRA